jgi:acyl-coenzyme A synthetase/AMP-(fatty) acid ligase
MSVTSTAIARHAAARPGAPAAVNNGYIVTYGELHRWVSGFARAIAALGLPPRAKVAIECQDQFLHLMLMLACERLGASTLSLMATDFSHPMPPLADLDLSLSEDKASRTVGRRCHPITLDWVEAAMAQDAEPPAAPFGSYANDDPVRLVHTSGTTGAAKRVVLTHRMVEQRIESWRGLYRAAPGDRHFIGSPFAVNSMYWQAAVALRLGGSVAIQRHAASIEALGALGISHIVLMPLLLDGLLERSGPGAAKPPGLTLLTIGGRVAPELRRRALDRLATRLIEVYSTNEAGNIAVSEGNAPRAAVLPGVEVEIVGSRGEALPRGTEGEIRVRAPYMVDGIAGDPAATARAFKDGWLHPGDVGILDSEGRLEVLGRGDDMINVGGVKILPERVEDQVHARTAVSDVALCSIRGAGGSDEVWAAVCCPGDVDDGLIEKLRPFFGQFPEAWANLVQLAAIPRTDTGKVKRNELRHAVAEAVAAGRGRRAAWAKPTRS